MTRDQSPITLKAVTEADKEFLLRVYEASREIELAMAPWSAEQKRVFVAHQFAAQDNHYREHYAGASFDLIIFAGEPAGRLYVHRGDQQIEILDITILPEYRNRGIAKSLVGEIINEASRSGRSVVIYIESFNPSQKLFRQLGFKLVGGDDIVGRFEWTTS
ncbi:MAG TPA: GNAT family N-acetyltransferase [Pyrinomonadaceae bacterium]|nr:GNAT family N-acetyltransferase [Pyrinomonadaceae bacterium]